MKPLIVIYEEDRVARTVVDAMASRLRNHGYDTILIPVCDYSAEAIRILDVSHLPIAELQDIRKILEGK